MVLNGYDKEIVFALELDQEATYALLDREAIVRNTIDFIDPLWWYRWPKLKPS